MNEGLSLEELLEHFSSNAIGNALRELGLDQAGSRVDRIDRLLELDGRLEQQTGAPVSDVLAAFEQHDLEGVCAALDIPTSEHKADTVAHLEDLIKGSDAESDTVAHLQKLIKRADAVPIKDLFGKAEYTRNPLIHLRRPDGSASGKFCDGCGAQAPTKYVAFHQNIGFFVIWCNVGWGMLLGGRPLDALAGKYDLRLVLSDSIRADLCRTCIDSYSWKFTITTFALGWWGYIAFFVTPVRLIGNVVTYLRSRRV